MKTAAPVSIATSDPINAKILAVSEDKIQGFVRDPFAQIAQLSGLELPVVIERIQAMLRGGTIRRVRQTLMSTSLAPGALVAWKLPEEKLSAAFDYMFQKDPFSGHVVIRSTDSEIAGAKYRLWTTLKVPHGYSMPKHCQYLAARTGAQKFLLLPAKKLFALGVGHVRRRGMAPGSKSEQLAEVTDTDIVQLNQKQWRVLMELKREFTAEEIRPDPWRQRAQNVGMPIDEFLEIARSLNQRQVIGRFSTFLEHVKTLKTGEQVTRYNALFHWAVPPGHEIDAGRQVGRFDIMTHAYWREAGPEFGNVNIMGVAHGTDKTLLLAHKQAIDQHLAQVGIPVSYTNVFWGGRSEIKPSEISPMEYERWCRENGIEPGQMAAP